MKQMKIGESRKKIEAANCRCGKRNKENTGCQKIENNERNELTKAHESNKPNPTPERSNGTGEGKKESISNQQMALIASHKFRL